MEKVMVVEDDPDTRKAVKTLLETEGYEVHECGSGIHCLENVGKVKPDVILLDIMLPSMSGYETYERLKKKAPQAKVIMLTVVGKPDVVKSMKDRGVHAYFVKPFEMDELLKSIKKAVGRKK